MIFKVRLVNAGTHQELAAKLRRLRKQAGVSTYVVARLTGLSQSKVSRIELGTTVPSVAETIMLCSVFQVSTKVRKSLVDVAVSLGRSQRFSPSGLPATRMSIQQDLVRQLELSVRRVIGCNWSFIPAQVQSTEYIARVGELSFGTSSDIRSFVALRLQRQVDAYRLKRQQTFVVPYDLLARPLLDRSAWLTQLELIKSAVDNGVIELGITPIGAEVFDIPVGSSKIYDNDLVVIEEGLSCEQDTTVASIDRERRRYQSLSNAAVWEDEAMKLLDEVISLFRTIDLGSPTSSPITPVQPAFNSYAT